MTKGEKIIIRNLIRELNEACQESTDTEDKAECEHWINALEWALWRFRYSKPTKKRRRA